MTNRFIKKIISVSLIALLCIITSSCVGEMPQNNIVITQPVDELQVVFMDVGQGDCEIIRFPDGRNMLIDGGTNKSEDILVYQIQEMGISKFDWVIATHPHEDHIGGLDFVIDNFEIGCVYMPDAVSATGVFEKLLTSIENKQLKVLQAKAGITVIDEENINMVLVAPNSDEYDDINNYSVVARLTYGNRSFLFTGDAEKLSEYEMLNNGMDLSADVLKVAHHGSDSSTSEGFLKTVNPSYAVIEVGVENRYNHPTDEVLKALSDTELYRTDINGMITAVCDGINIKFTTER